MWKGYRDKVRNVRNVKLQIKLWRSKEQKRKIRALKICVINQLL